MDSDVSSNVLKSQRLRQDISGSRHKDSFIRTKPKTRQIESIEFPFKEYSVLSFRLSFIMINMIQSLGVKLVKKDRFISLFHYKKVPYIVR